MDSPKTLQQHIQTLPLELKILVIHWTVQVSKTIQSSRRGPGPSLTVLRHGNIPVLLDAEKANPISGRLGLFSTDAELAKIAFEEFWKVNVFQVYSSHWFGHTASLFPQHLGLLLDETSRRQYIQHLVLYVDEDNHYNRMEGGIKDWISINEVNILWQLAGACPKLQSLMVEINYTINEDCPSWWQDPEPYYAIAWEREHCKLSFGHNTYTRHMLIKPNNIRSQERHSHGQRAAWH